MTKHEIKELERLENKRRNKQEQNRYKHLLYKFENEEELTYIQKAFSCY